MDASVQQDHGQQRPLAATAPRVRCRQATTADAVAIATLLTRGFPERSPSYWTRSLAMLGAHATPPNCPKYGYVLEVADRLVGVILLIFSAMRTGETTSIRCNVSSWFVEPPYRSYASLLITAATRRKDVTYVNISPAPHTRQTIELQGFTCYAEGQLYCLPALTPRRGDVRIRVIAPDVPVSGPDMEVLAAHASYGCLSLLCEADGQSHPFVFLPRRLARSILPGAQLVYCRDTADFARLAGSLGWFLLKRGLPCVVLNTSGPVPGLVGRYYPGRAPMYYKGPQPPVLNDIAFTEMVLFGN